MNSREHEFGGYWTQQKLVRVRKYLEAYGTIFQSNKRARKLNTYYVDAFAGTGFSRPKAKDKPEQTFFFGNDEIEDVQSFKKGSAALALEVEPSLKNYLFIEKSNERIDLLKQLKEKYPEKANRIKVFQGDANDILIKWCRDKDWRYQRAVVFLDPYGMQVEWRLLKAIAETKAIDLWLLFPVGMGVMRMLTKNKLPSQEWCDSLTRSFGTEEWKDAFYKKEVQPDLFGIENEILYKDADFDKIGQFMLERLGKIFTKVHKKPLLLKNSRNVPMYFLCFAVGNEVGAKTAIKIANHILK